jgi:hypothetical protein
MVKYIRDFLKEALEHPERRATAIGCAESWRNFLGHKLTGEGVPSELQHMWTKLALVSPFPDPEDKDVEKKLEELVRTLRTMLDELKPATAASTGSG